MPNQFHRKRVFLYVARMLEHSEKVGRFFSAACVDLKPVRSNQNDPRSSFFIWWDKKNLVGNCAFNVNSYEN